MIKDFFKKNKKLDIPMILNQKTATMKNVEKHAILRQRLKATTIEKYIRYARFMKKHKIPIDFNKLDYTDFIRHMDYRECVEKATPDALCNEWKAMKMFL